MALTKSQVSELYVSIFNRASEGTGNTYWQSTADLATAATAMLNTADAKTYFGTSLDTDQAFIEHIYLNTLNKTYAQDTAGVDYWVGQLATSTRGEVVASLVNAVATYATSTDATTKAAYDQFTNRVAVSDNMADTVSAAPTDYATSTSFVTSSNPTGGLTVSNDAATVATANTAVSVIADATVTPTYTITSATTSVTEGSSLVFTVTSSAAFASKSTTLNYQISGVSVAGGTASPSADLGKVTGEVTIAAGATTGTITITPTDDGTTEGFEGFKVSLLDNNFVTVGTSASVVIKDGAEAGTTQNLASTTDNLSGTSGDDTFNSVSTANAGTGTTILAGDVINAGAGTDTLNVSISGSSSTAAVTIQAFQAKDLEKVLVSNYDSHANTHTIDLTLSTGTTTVGSTSSGLTGDTLFTGLNSNLVAAEMKNGSGDVTVTYGTTVVAGTADTQALTVSNNTGGTFTAAGVETITANSTLAASTLVDIVGANMTKLVVTGDQNLTVTNAVNFAVVTDTATIASTIDGSAATGNLNLTIGDTSTTSVTTGTGADRINMAATLEKNDVINGGAGTDKLTMTAAALTTQFTNVSNIETVAFNEVETAIAMDVSKLSAGVTTVEVDVDDGAAENSAVLANTVSGLSGQTVNIKHTESDASDTTDNDGVKYTLTNAVDTAADTINVTLDGVGTGATGSSTTNFGINELDVGNFETINIASNTNSVATVAADGTTAAVAKGAVTLNTLDLLTAGSAASIVLSGATDLTVTSIIGSTTATTSLDASAMTGNFIATLGTASNLAVKLAADSSTINFAGTLNASDSVTGGAGTADIVTATVTGLSATTGALSTTAVETINLTTSGNNALALAGVVGATTVAVTDNVQTITGLNIATTSITLGLVGDESATASEIDVTATDATGTTDTLNVIVENTNGNATSIIDASAIETLAITTVAVDNNTTLDLTTFEGTAVTVGAKTGVTVTTGEVALGTLHANTNSVTSSFIGDFATSFANSTSAATFTGAGTSIQTVTGSANADTFNIGSTAAITHVLAGGAGEDTLNITAAAGLANVGSISAIQTVNATVTAGADVTLTTSFHADVDDVTITGGNSLSTFTTGTLLTSVETLNAGTFAGNIVADVAADALDSTVTITGGALATDQVNNTVTTAATTYSLKSTGVEILALDVNGAGNTTVSMANATGATSVTVDLAAAITAAVTISGITNEVLTLTAAAGGDDTLIASLASSSGATDSVGFKIGAGNAAGAKLQTTDVETVSINTDNAVSLDLSLLSMATVGKVMSLTATGDSALTVTAINADVTTIDASAMTAGGQLIMTGSSVTAASTITGSAGADTIIMANKDDAIAGGTGADTLDVNYTSVIGGMAIDLSNTVDQITTFNGASNGAVQTGFQHVDLSGYTGNGSEITANASGSNIVGTTSVDSITLGAAADKVSFNTVNGADVISSFTINSDTLDFGTITGITSATEVAMATGSTKHAGTTATTYVFASDQDGGAGGTITTFTDMTDVASYLSANITAANGEKYVAVVNDLSGQDVYAYFVQATATGAATIEAAEVTLIGTINNIGAVALDINEIV